MKRRYQVLLFSASLILVFGLGLHFLSSDEEPSSPVAGAAPSEAAPPVSAAAAQTALEDLAEALATVQDGTSADLVAARVAVACLVLREHAPLADEAGAALESRVQQAAAGLEELEFHGSSGLRAALSLMRLRPGHASPLPRPEAAAAGVELLVNGRDVIVLFLDSVASGPAAESVVPHLESALAYGQVMEQFLAGFAEDELPAGRAEELRAQLEDSRRDLQEAIGGMLEQECYGCAELHALLEAM